MSRWFQNAAPSTGTRMRHSLPLLLFTKRNGGGGVSGTPRFLFYVNLHLIFFDVTILIPSSRSGPKRERSDDGVILWTLSILKFVTLRAYRAKKGKKKTQQIKRTTLIINH